MAQFDVYIVDGGLVLDCQSSILSGLSTRMVVPLLPVEIAPKAADRLNPVFDLSGERCVMMTQYMAAVPSKILGRSVGSLADHHVNIVGAIDFLLSGF